MIVYRIWNETRQEWYKSYSGRLIWMNLSGASLAKNYYLNAFRWLSEKPDQLVIKKFELKEIEE